MLEAHPVLEPGCPLPMVSQSSALQVAAPTGMVLRTATTQRGPATAVHWVHENATVVGFKGWVVVVGRGRTEITRIAMMASHAASGSSATSARSIE